MNREELLARIIWALIKNKCAGASKELSNERTFNLGNLENFKGLMITKDQEIVTVVAL